MPFVTRCPHQGCQRFLLLEDEVNGKVVTCLCCKKDINLGPEPEVESEATFEEVPEDSEDHLLKDFDLSGIDLRSPKERSGSSFRPEASKPQRDTAQPHASVRFNVKACPKCGRPLRIEVGYERHAIGCTDCNFWGIP